MSRLMNVMKCASSMFIMTAFIIGITRQHVWSVTLTADNVLHDTVFSTDLFANGVIQFLRSLFYNVEQAVTCDIHTHGCLKPVEGFRHANDVLVI
ncbi:hypothetical protein DPMN_043949 [Dreissena polymorpha]|uniref:Uncharacterized protein n=1 Tax=Dreissena polymorpha TaxID=45954 RepID=A0A9D4I043_DREPO|nr:hypothetical protein DPMN_043949 [Dreissena polymorpha]